MIAGRQSRGAVLRGAASLAAAAGLASAMNIPAVAAPPRTVKFTLAWLAQGSSLYTYVGRAKGFFKKRGIDLEISRGFGSLAAAQAIAGGQFDYGIVFANALILSQAKGLALTAIATVEYDGTMGVGVLAESPIRSSKDLAGKKIGAVPTSAEYPFFPAYMKRVGLDPKGVEIVLMDNKVLERALIDRRVDAIMGIGSSSLPVLLTQQAQVRWMLYSSYGIKTYGQTIAARPATIAAEPALSEALVDGMMESLQFTLNNPDESVEIFSREVPEMALNPNATAFNRIGLGMQQYAISKPEAREHGLGWGDHGVYEQMTDLVMQYAAAADMKRPEVAVEFTNRYAGKFKLTSRQWTDVVARSTQYSKLIS